MEGLVLVISLEGLFNDVKGGGGRHGCHAMVCVPVCGPGCGWWLWFPFGCTTVGRASGWVTALAWGFDLLVGAWCVSLAWPAVALLGVFFGSGCWSLCVNLI